MSFALRIQGITKRFDGKRALDRIHLDIERGSVHVLLGSSGSGKTTLLRIILGLIEPDEGTLSRDGDQVGYIPQDGGLFPHLTARKNATLVAEVKEWPESRIRQRLLELCPIVDLPLEFLDRFPAELSGGQRQRVSLLRAAFMDPPLLLLDEPLGALDPITRASVQEELRRVFRALKKTVVLVTHDLEEARYFGDTITLMDQGRVIQTGTFEQLLRNPVDPFVSRFIQASRTWGVA